MARRSKLRKMRIQNAKKMRQVVKYKRMLSQLKGNNPSTSVNLEDSIQIETSIDADNSKSDFNTECHQENENIMSLTAQKTTEVPIEIKLTSATQGSVVGDESSTNMADGEEWSEKTGVDAIIPIPIYSDPINNQSTSAIKFGADKNIQACLKTSREDSFEKENKLLAQKVVRLHKLQDSVEIKNDVKVFCTDISHTAQAIQEEQTKIHIAKLYHYFEQEYEELKTIYGDLDLTPLSNFCQRTARATGVSETTVVQILNEKEARNAEKLQETNLSRARTRSMHTDSLCEEDDSDDIADPDENSIHFNGAETLLVKVEPEDYDNDEPGTYLPAAVKQELGDSEVITEQPLIDPIPLNMQTGPESDIFDQSGLLEEAEVKVEEIEIEEEGFS